ncbi:MAG: YggS family pyridoxal phosphate-dependent enzyme [Planctomycetota bacterium]
MTLDLERFRQNYLRLEHAVGERARRCGFAAPRIVIVTKYLALDDTHRLVKAGFGPLGESRAQDLVAKCPVAGVPRANTSHPRWHFIGHLQRNKLGAVLSRVELVHSLDSRRLVDAIHAALVRTPTGDYCRRFLVQVNTSGEATKGGLSPEAAATEVPRWIEEFPELRIEGLMTIAPVADAAVCRACFRRLRETRDRIQDVLAAPNKLSDLSMGMSGDFEVAVEEGATWIRLGSILYD